jgi:Putative prokaryotic signal transducing protein
VDAERFCRDCGVPLVHVAGDGGHPLSPARERARKMRPQFAEGPLVRVATARHQAEAEMLEGLLLEEGVPSLVRRSGGFDVPDFLASGPRDILVPASGADRAREVLGPAGPLPLRATGEGTPAWVKAMAVFLAVGIAALIAAGVFAAVF